MPGAALSPTLGIWKLVVLYIISTCSIRRSWGREREGRGGRGRGEEGEEGGRERGGTEGGREGGREEEAIKNFAKITN